jgi:hypothetical protein
MRTVEVPEPIGEKFFHRYVNGTVQHHEVNWDGLRAECPECGLIAVVSWKPFEVFVQDEELMSQLCEPIA